jgi:hypothetical protein
MRPEDRHHDEPAVTDTPAAPAADWIDIPEHTSSKNSSRSSYDTRRFAITTPQSFSVA